MCIVGISEVLCLSSIFMPSPLQIFNDLSISMDLAILVLHSDTKRTCGHSILYHWKCHPILTMDTLHQHSPSLSYPWFYRVNSGPPGHLHTSATLDLVVSISIQCTISFSLSPFHSCNSVLTSVPLASLTTLTLCFHSMVESCLRSTALLQDSAVHTSSI